MLNFDKPNIGMLAETYASFIPKERINRTALTDRRHSKRAQFERKYGKIYTAASIATGIGIICALVKGGNAKKLKNIFQNKINQFTTKAKNELEIQHDFRLTEKLKIKTGLFFSSIFQKVLSTGNFIGNLNPFKDIAFDKFTKYTKIKPIFDKITNLFVKSAKNLTNSKYNKASKKLTDFTLILDRAIEHVKTIPVIKTKNGNISGTQLAQKLEQLSAQMTETMQNIGGENFKKRFDLTVKTLSTSEEEFLNAFKEYQGNSIIQKLKSKIKECGDFLPAKIMEKHHKQIYAPLMKSKKALSNSVLDLYQTASKSIEDVFYNNTLDNSNLRQSYVNIRELLSKFKEASSYSVKRQEIRINLLNELSNAVNYLKTAPNNYEKVHILQELITKIKTDKRGMVEEAVSSCKILKETAPELYSKLIKCREQFQNKFNDAILFETDKTYRKLLDFSLHSLPTDLLTMGAGVGTVGCITASKKKSRQEKISLNLKNGIPVLGGIAVSFLSNMRQVTSGTGAIFLGIASGLILNRLGRITNHYYLKSQKKPKQNKNL